MRIIHGHPQRDRSVATRPLNAGALLVAEAFSGARFGDDVFMATAEDSARSEARPTPEHARPHASRERADPVPNTRSEPTVVTASARSPNECSICLSHVQPGDAFRTMPCFHTFHATCVDTWLAENRTCPTCRRAC